MFVVHTVTVELIWMLLGIDMLVAVRDLEYTGYFLSQDFSTHLFLAQFIHLFFDPSITSYYTSHRWSGEF